LTEPVSLLTALFFALRRLAARLLGRVAAHTATLLLLHGAGRAFVGFLRGGYTAETDYRRDGDRSK
jgi:hypothetical protein